MTLSSLNQIQRSTFVRASRSRVWRALTDISEFCKWFSAETDDPAFQPGANIKFRSTYPGPYYKMEFSVNIEEMAAEQTFSWRWHPGAKVPGEDVSSEPMTLVTFTLEDAEGGTRVTVTETGFDELFATRRDRAFKDNDSGWKTQMAAFEGYFSEGA
jgi:uncharacterized protein YndB with AHSA1/START domain